ncbi:GNAT family N-acetyltransferase [uncultured Hymenobacter sp.]|uniref:GNAT family N-acetyltransferase n=1 Tax=uncultured Hymenobacter sp. TaxID=170016 RepID=UPI0035CB61C2
MSASTSAALPRIQPATLRDIPTIMALAEATWEPTYRFIISKEQLEYMYRVIYTPASLRRQMQDEHHTFLVAYVDERPAGYASFGPLPAAVPTPLPADKASLPTPPAAPKAFKLHKIYVLPSQQGQRLGVRLLEAVEQAAQAAQGRFLELNVNRHNAAALGFYERHGYQQQREEDIPIGPYWMNDFVLRKELV